MPFIKAPEADSESFADDRELSIPPRHGRP